MLIFERFSPKRRRLRRRRRYTQLTVLSREEEESDGCSGHELIPHQPPELAQLSPKAFWEKAEKTDVCPEASVVPEETPPRVLTGQLRTPVFWDLCSFLPAPNMDPRKRKARRDPPK